MVDSGVGERDGQARCPRVGTTMGGRLSLYTEHSLAHAVHATFGNNDAWRAGPCYVRQETRQEMTSFCGDCMSLTASKLDRCLTFNV
jgi:hypothetical protein